MTVCRKPSPPTHNVKATIFSPVIGTIGPLSFAYSSKPLLIEQSVVHSANHNLNSRIHARIAGKAAHREDRKFKVTLAITPNSQSDYDLYRVGIIAFKKIEYPQSSDSIKLSIAYPDGTVTGYDDGKILSFPSSPSIGHDGKLKPSIYEFEFDFINRTLPEKNEREI